MVNICSFSSIVIFILEKKVYNNQKNVYEYNLKNIIVIFSSVLSVFFGIAVELAAVYEMNLEILF
ncbi:hypothetical protein A33Q_0047 [Indibacter alkaliphilus LW1]|uniref:Uncharacterized protein n=1 Tax=Indibacter alkaliphilus (strain CCUG 57479 / KCTC 22604 / LW1) TaxID=1189612 RepID=S2EE07_INDAL|nr:hypothetical protein A33Q_0047 [Indibacter alkaliphilus LW1]